MKNVLVVGGASGIGLSISLCLQKQGVYVYVLDINAFPEMYKGEHLESYIFDVTASDYSLLSQLPSIQELYITAGFGKLGLVQDFDDEYIQHILSVDAAGPIRIIRHYYECLLSEQPFPCAVMVSIAGRVSSPLFSYYSAAKAAVRMFIEAANIELEVQGSNNRILEVSPGSLKGTSFNGGASDPSFTMELAEEIISKARKQKTIFIPQYEEVFKGVIERYHNDSHEYGLHSYWYKKNGRKNK